MGRQKTAPPAGLKFKRRVLAAVIAAHYNAKQTLNRRIAEKL